jgi:drug/metabolite transporter (DMT)-like permease
MASFWIVATLIASAAQTARNAMQSTLTASIGTIGAAQVRFLYGFPFSLLFLLGTVMVTGEAVPAADRVFLSYAASGAVLQIVGTVLMLAAMRLRSFAVATAYLKTEPVLVALASVVVLGEHLDPQAWLAIVIATLGVLVLTWKNRHRGPSRKRVNGPPPFMAWVRAGVLRWRRCCFAAASCIWGRRPFMCAPPRCCAGLWASNP